MKDRPEPVGGGTECQQRQRREQGERRQAAAAGQCGAAGEEQAAQAERQHAADLVGEGRAVHCDGEIRPGADQQQHHRDREAQRG